MDGQTPYGHIVKTLHEGSPDERLSAALLLVRYNLLDAEKPFPKAFPELKGLLTDEQLAVVLKALIDRNSLFLLDEGIRSLSCELGEKGLLPEPIYQMSPQPPV